MLLLFLLSAFQVGSEAEILLILLDKEAFLKFLCDFHPFLLNAHEIKQV